MCPRVGRPPKALVSREQRRVAGITAAPNRFDQQAREGRHIPETKIEALSRNWVNAVRRDMGPMPQEQKDKVNLRDWIREQVAGFPKGEREPVGMGAPVRLSTSGSRPSHKTDHLPPKFGALL